MVILIHLSTIKKLLLILEPAPTLNVDFAGSKSSKKVVSREEAIAVIDEQYRCVLPCLFLFVYPMECLSSSGGSP